jgi:hypothetical protein
MLSMAYATMRWLIIVREPRVAEQDAHPQHSIVFDTSSGGYVTNCSFQAILPEAYHTVPFT